VDQAHAADLNAIARAVNRRSTAALPRVLVVVDTRELATMRIPRVTRGRS
jgi:hypothetical protein